MKTSFAMLAAQARMGQADIPDHWKQGRTAYGGLSAALLLEHARQEATEETALPPLRSALINFTGPVTSAPSFTSAPLRRGRNVTTVYSTAQQDDATVCTATFSFGASRESHIRQDLPGPDAPSPADTPSFIPPNGERFAPGFLGNFDLQRIAGDMPMSGSDRGYIRCWARHKDEASRLGTGSLLCLADILPPAAFPMMRQLGPVSSMSWICNFLTDDLSTDDGWWQVEAELSAARDGYSSQVMRIWNTAGELVIEGLQSITIFV